MDILTIINKKTTFQELHNILKCDKRQLGQALNLLEKEGKLISFKDKYYKVSDLERVEGWITPGAKSGVFFTTTQPLIELGANYTLEGERSVVNKKGLLPGSFVAAYEIEEGLVFVAEKLVQHDFEFLGQYTVHRVEVPGVGLVEKGLIKAFIKGFDLSIQTVQEQESGSWGHYVYSAGGITLKCLVAQENSRGFYSELSSYILKHNPKNYIEVSTAQRDLEYKDLTYLPFYTIDSISTKDIDDAIFFSGNKLYIAIADASYYVSKNLDIAAQKQTSSFYLPNKVEHMLPRELSEKEVSLNPGIAKKSMVCEIILKEGEVETCDFYLAQIKTAARLTYLDVDRMLAGDKPIESTIVEREAEVRKSLVKLMGIVEQNQIAQPDVYRPQRTEILLSENGLVHEIVLEEERGPAQKLVEYCMITANIQAAKYIHEKYNTTALFRNQVMQDNKLKSAVYENNLVGHVSLNSDFYTHFTSPIRRYSDLMIHRIMKDIFSETKQYDNETLTSIANHLNHMGRKMKAVEQKVEDLMKNHYIEALQDKRMQASIVDITMAGVVFRTNKNIEFFVPAFKLDEALFNKIDEFMTNNSDKKVEPFKAFLEELNKVSYEIELKDIDSIFDKKLLTVHTKAPAPSFKP